MSILKKEYLELDESQSFDVTWQYEENIFAGKIFLSKKEIKIKFTGEMRHGRQFPLFSIPDDTLTCFSFTDTFILHNLKPLNGSSRHLDRYTTFFECEYSVEYLIFLPTTYNEKKCDFDSITIHSIMINDWVGITKKQQQILQRHINGDNLFKNTMDLDQISCEINTGLSLTIEYNLSTHHSVKNFNYGFEYSPSLSLYFESKQPSSSIKNTFDHIYSLLGFLNGGDFPVKKVPLRFTQHGYVMHGYLYFPTEQEHQGKKHSYSFFPLGHDLAFDTLGLPSLPLCVFENFFSLDEKHKSLFCKLLKYRRMENIEERFLGYFRLLESLCHNTKCHIDADALNVLIGRAKPFMKKYFNDSKGVSSFLNGLPRYNRSKYNTEKCISDFYKKIPQIVTDNWDFNSKNIKDVCTLRNDITHANNFYIEESEIIKKTSFVEALLIFALGEKIGINVDIMATVIHRMTGYHVLMKSDAYCVRTSN
ncbi:HEPN domain-containing protein [Aeromonas veronii]|uniref:HEPN domain-containing protein n=1 Tax=Aeromonas veronii TaxID=654 RepID=UPI0035B9DA8D